MRILKILSSTAFVFCLIMPAMMDAETEKSEVALSENRVNFNEIKSYSIDELLEFKQIIEQALVEKGYELYFDISHGEKGEHVARLQKRLKDLYYYDGAINGKYDSQTEKAVKQFQKTHGIKSTGIASQELQNLLYSSSVDLEITPMPKITPKPTVTPDPSLSDYEELNYVDAARYPEKYLYKKVILRGKAIQVIGTKETGFTIRLATSGNSDIVYLNVPRGLSFNILENDRLIVYAEMKGTKTYLSTFGQSITIPQATADSLQLR